MIDILNISKSFATSSGELAVISELSLHVAQGQIVAIAGPSGCGKSTLIRLCAGLDRADSGSVEVALERAVGPALSIAFQEHGLLEWLTLEQNVKLGLELRKMSISDDDITDVITRVGLSEFRKAYPDQLSGGMKSRAALARALADRSPVVLLDEPFRSLDEVTRFAVARDCVALLRQRGQTVLLVTHSISEAVRLADRVVVVSSRPMSIVLDQQVELSIAEREAIASQEVAYLTGKLQKVIFEQTYG